MSLGDCRLSVPVLRNAYLRVRYHEGEVVEINGDISRVEASSLHTLRHAASHRGTYEEFLQHVIAEI